jgi:hypothetical protein
VAVSAATSEICSSCEVASTKTTLRCSILVGRRRHCRQAALR